MTRIPLRPDDYDTVVNIFASKAAAAASSPKDFFRSLIHQANLPARWKQDMAGVWTGDAHGDAVTLVTWAEVQGGTPNDRRYSTLGSLIKVLLPGLGIEDCLNLAIVIIGYDLYRDETLIRELATQYHIPLPAARPEPQTRDFAAVTDSSEVLAWFGVPDALELQSYAADEPDTHDIGFLRRAVERASSVCRIDLLEPDGIKPSGTGVLINPTMVLTNYHVLTKAGEDGLKTRAHDAVLCFAEISGESGKSSAGLPFRTVSDQPVVSFSPIDQLDYVLLRVDEEILQHTDQIKPAPVTDELPEPKMRLSILHHPLGQSMQLTMTNNGVVSVLPDQGLVRYITRTERGSSGSPCFNNSWAIIALHHGEQVFSYGRAGEGVILRNIHKEIESFL